MAGDERLGINGKIGVLPFGCCGGGARSSPSPTSLIPPRLDYYYVALAGGALANVEPSP